MVRRNTLKTKNFGPLYFGHFNFGPENAAREGTDGQFIFYILNIIYKMKNSKSGAAAAAAAFIYSGDNTYISHTDHILHDGIALK